MCKEFEQLLYRSLQDYCPGLTKSKLEAAAIAVARRHPHGNRITPDVLVAELQQEIDKRCRPTGSLPSRI